MLKSLKYTNTENQQCSMLRNDDDDDDGFLRCKKEGLKDFL